MASRCFGELVRKMGDKILAAIVPTLTGSMSSERAGTRQGVCFGLREVLDGMTREQLAEHLPAMLPAVQAALCDGDEGVRAAAGEAFSVLFKGGAGRCGALRMACRASRSRRDLRASPHFTLPSQSLTSTLFQSSGRHASRAAGGSCAGGARGAEPGGPAGDPRRAPAAAGLGAAQAAGEPAQGGVKGWRVKGFGSEVLGVPRPASCAVRELRSGVR